MFNNLFEISVALSIGINLSDSEKLKFRIKFNGKELYKYGKLENYFKIL